MPQVYRRLKRNRMISMIGSFIFAFIFLISFFLSFSGRLLKDTIEDCENHLQIFAEQGIGSMRADMEHSMDLLRSYALLLSKMSNISASESQEAPLFIRDRFDFIGVASLDGKTKLPHAETANVKDRFYFQRAAVGEETFSYMPFLEEEEQKHLILSVPITKGGEIRGVLFGTFERGELLSMTSRISNHPNLYFHFFIPSGEYILRSEDRRSVLSQDSIWKDLSEVEFQDDYSLAAIQRDTQLNRSNYTHYSKDGKDRFCYYAPLGLDNWYILAVAEDETVYEGVREINVQVFHLLLKSILLFIAILILFLYYNRVIQKEILTQNQKLRISEENFRIAASNAKNCIFNYNVQNGTFTMETMDQNRWGFPQMVKNFPQFIIKEKLFDEPSSRELERACKEIREGAATASCILKKRTLESESIWGKMVLSNIFDDNGEIVHCVGVIEDISEQKRQEYQYLQEQEYRKMMYAQTLGSYEVNLTTNRLILANGERGESYTDTFRKMSERVHEEDLPDMQKLLSMEGLLRAYQEEDRDLRLEFRLLEGQQEIWTECQVHLSLDPVTKEVKAILMLKDIDKRKRRELSLQYRAKVDPLTKLLNREEAINQINCLLENSQISPGYQVFLILDIDNFKTVNDQLGHAMGDKVLVEVAEKLSKRFRRSDIIGRLGGDEFILFLPDVDSLESAAGTARQLVQLMQKTYGKDGKSVSVSVSVGIAFAPDQGTTFRELYEKADIALYTVKNIDKNGFAVYSPSMAEKISQLKEENLPTTTTGQSL